MINEGFDPRLLMIGMMMGAMILILFVFIGFFIWTMFGGGL